MAAFQTANFYRPRPLTVDTNTRQYYEEDDSSILDEHILDHQSALDSSLEMSTPIVGSRRHSYALSSAMFSPKAEDWQHVEMQQSLSNHSFADHNTNSFMASAHATNFPQQSQNWLGNASGSCTPMQSFDGLPSDFDGVTVGYRSMQQAQTPFSNTGHQVSLFSPANTSGESVPTSPQKDWLPESLEHGAMPKRMRPNSPGLRSHSPLLRRGGIRKKNARFDIPAERNLLNIDQLIAQSTDEHEIKELKQQKRLLRNRQAAYAHPYFGHLSFFFGCPGPLTYI